jgi:hypothetical protein
LMAGDRAVNNTTADGQIGQPPTPAMPKTWGSFPAALFCPRYTDRRSVFPGALCGCETLGPRTAHRVIPSVVMGQMGQRFGGVGRWEWLELEVGPMRRRGVPKCKTDVQRFVKELEPIKRRM